MERIKDFLFDLSDIAISLLIVAVIFFVVSWKLNETMPMSFSLSADQTEVASEASVPVNTQAPEVVQVTTAPEVVPVSTQDAQNEADTTITEPVTTAKPAEPTTQAPSPSKRITVEIPSGSTGDAIAKILKNRGLIDDISAFNKTVENLGLGNKLRAGTFTLTTDMTLETLARRIAGFKN